MFLNRNLFGGSMKYLTIAATALALSAGAASAATIHDEASDGDLANFLTSVGGVANLSFTLPSGATSTVLGDLDAGLVGDPDDGVDEFDVFQFTVTETFTVDLNDLVGDVFATLYEDGGSGTFSFLGFAGFGTDSTDIFSSLGTFSAGTYAIGVGASGNGGVHSYSASINVADGTSVSPVPLPAGFPLLAAGLIGLGVLARRKKAA